MLLKAAGSDTIIRFRMPESRSAEEMEAWYSAMKQHAGQQERTEPEAVVLDAPAKRGVRVPAVHQINYSPNSIAEVVRELSASSLHQVIQGAQMPVALVFVDLDLQRHVVRAVAADFWEEHPVELYTTDEVDLVPDVNVILVARPQPDRLDAVTAFINRHNAKYSLRLYTCAWVPSKSLICEKALFDLYGRTKRVASCSLQIDLSPVEEDLLTMEMPNTTREEPPQTIPNPQTNPYHNARSWVKRKKEASNPWLGR